MNKYKNLMVPLRILGLNEAAEAAQKRYIAAMAELDAAKTEQSRLTVVAFELVYRYSRGFDCAYYEQRAIELLREQKVVP